MHHGRACIVDGAAEHLGEQCTGLRGREALHREAPHNTHPAHVGHQVHGLRHERELLGADREHQEDRARADGADHVAEQTEAVLVRPLKVVDEQGDGSHGRELTERDGAEVEGSQQSAIGLEGCEPRIVLPGHRIETALEGLRRTGSCGRGVGLR